MIRVRRVLVGAATVGAALALVGCAAQQADTGAAGTSLSVEVVPAQGEAYAWTLSCDPVGGTHPQATAACALLAEADDSILDPVPADAICTEIYGGPDRAYVTGTWRGRVIDLALDRTNGCHIAQWDALAPLVPPGNWTLESPEPNVVR